MENNSEEAELKFIKDVRENKFSCKIERGQRGNYGFEVKASSDVSLDDAIKQALDGQATLKQALG